MMARYPAPMAGWSRDAADGGRHDLARRSRRRCPSGCRRRTWGRSAARSSFFGLDPRNGRDFVLQTIEGGGWGGRPWEDGESASVSVCQGDVRNAPIETIELKTPVLVEQRALREDSGGAGKYRGGLGMMTQMRELDRRPLEHEQQRAAANCRRGACGAVKPGAASQNLMRAPGEAEFHHERSGPPAAPRRHQRHGRDRRRRRLGRSVRTRSGAGALRRRSKAVFRSSRRATTTAS